MLAELMFVLHFELGECFLSNVTVKQKTYI